VALLIAGVLAWAIVRSKTQVPEMSGSNASYPQEAFGSGYAPAHEKIKK
jgi:hypothetical protein